MDLNNFDKITKKNIESWLSGPYDNETKEEIKSLIKTNPEKLKDAFFKNLSFGTAGARGLMGIGTNRLNIYTIRSMTQALCNYLKKVKNKTPISVVIGYDNRKNSKLFARETAKVIAANDMKAYIFKELRPTPLVSYTCRFKKAAAAVMITASHNPPEYNGYKVYWDDGGQVLPPHDKGIIDEVTKIQQSEVKIVDDPHKNIEWLSETIDDEYIKTISSLKNFASKTSLEGKKINFVYSNLHGTGITLIPKATKDWGFTNIIYVEEQKPCDENFTYAKKPNPEEKKTLELGINLLIEKKADLFVATDPDADRMGVVVNHNNSSYILSGNQLACILLEHISKSLSKNALLPPKAACVKSIVTTDLFADICKTYNISCLNVLTGFKYIAEKIKQWETEPNSYQFIFGAEESYGYLRGTYARDKDAISTTCLLLEAACMAKENNKTLVDVMYDIYKQHGVYREQTFSFSFSEGEEGMKKIESIMHNLRKNTPKTIANCSIKNFEDYKTKSGIDFETKEKYELFLPKSDVIRFILSDNTKIIIRPSGTEPKIKLYIHVSEKNVKDVDTEIKKCDQRIDNFIKDMKNHIS